MPAVLIGMSATMTTPAIPDRTLRDAILAALALNTRTEKEEALVSVLKGWQEGDGSDNVRSPHLLVYLFNKFYDMTEQPLK
jgi:hypothetical protein